MREDRITTGLGFTRCWLLALGLVLALAACDLTVSNPGPVEDSFLDEEAAHDAVVHGAMRQFNNALSNSGGNFSLCGAVVSREWHPSGQTGSFACSVEVFRNELNKSDAGVVDRAQMARWLAENGVDRIRSVRGDRFSEYEMAAVALLYVGYSNRLLGEHVCRTVIDGGQEQPFTIHFERAEEAFSEALAIAQSQGNAADEHAALAGRASVRIWLGNWAGAVEDAAQVPKDFVFDTPFNTVEQNQSNSITIATKDDIRRNFTLWHTFYGEYYDEFQDPRVPYRKYPDTPFEVGLGQVPDLGDGRGVIGEVPYWQQRKYIEDDGPINLSSGREAMLIIAEDLLRNGDWEGALAIVNELRSDVGVALREASSVEETWTWLKLEKLIELWLEARAVGERRRWLGDGPDPAAPGPLPALLRMDDRSGTDRCWPISRAEKETNPNLQGAG